MKKKLFSLFVLLFLTTIIAFSVSADTNCYTFEVGIPFIKGFNAGDCPPPTSLGNMIVKFIKILFPLAGILAFVMIVVAGFEYATSGGDTNKQKDAQDRIVNAIIGLVLLFAFWVILNTINPDILNIQELSLESVSSPTTKSVNANMTKLNDFNIPLSYEFLSKGYPAYATFDLGDKLLALFVQTSKGTNPSWYITEACITNTLPCKTTYSGHETNSCHYSGTCVDIVLTTDNETNRQKFIETAKKVGLSIYDEYNCKSPGWTAEHFHVSLTCGSGSCWICPP